MTATSFATPRKSNLQLTIILVTLIPLSAFVARLLVDGHADSRHGNEQYPPRVIRACIAQAILDKTVFRYETFNGDKIALVCRLAENRYGIQVTIAVQEGEDVVIKEVTTFYSTLSRAKNILFRDSYVSVDAPLP